MKKLTIVFALALIVAACGDSSGADQSPAAEPASASATTAAPSTGETTTTAAPVDDHDEEMTEPADEEGDDHAEDEHSEDEHSEEVSQPENADGADRTVEVAMADFTYDPESFAVAAGETVAFVVSNLGAVEHEFRLSNEHRIEEHIVAGHQDHGDEGGHHEDGDVILLVDPGETGTIVVTFPEDTSLYTEVACLLPGHYEAGMHVPLTVDV